MFFDSEELPPEFLGIGPADPNAGTLERQVHVVALNHTYIPGNDSVLHVRYGYNSFVSDWRPQEFDAAGLGFSSNFLGQAADGHLPLVDVEGYWDLSPGAPSDGRS